MRESRGPKKSKKRFRGEELSRAGSSTGQPSSDGLVPLDGALSFHDALDCSDYENDIAGSAFERVVRLELFSEVLGGFFMVL